ncbi:DUF3365 domain-containing protein [Myxococcota bacterium]|nr:DUF3365 domain-containing protein [Myxococcota bacterium]
MGRIDGRGALLVIAGLVTACEGKSAGGIAPQTMTDALFSVMSADRLVYTREVVNRLQNEEKVLNATEHFRDEKTLPLPAQMFRMGSEASQKQNPGFTYSLLSLWPVNKQNAPKTELEKKALALVAESGKNFYGEEELGGKRYFTAVYPDKAVSEACVSCHNQHEDSPRKDFKLEQVMGAVVIRVPLGT